LEERIFYTIYKFRATFFRDRVCTLTCEILIIWAGHRTCLPGHSFNNSCLSNKTLISVGKSWIKT